MSQARPYHLVRFLLFDWSAFVSFALLFLTHFHTVPLLLLDGTERGEVNGQEEKTKEQ